MPSCRIPSAVHLATSVHAAAASLVLGFSMLLPASLHSQAAHGAIGVSLTVVEAVSSVAPRFSTAPHAGTGALFLDGSSPVTGPTSQIVMVALLTDDPSDRSRVHLTLHTPAGDRMLTRGVAVPSTATGLIPGNAVREAFPISYRIRTSARPDSSTPVAVRIAYLAVPGT